MTAPLRLMNSGSQTNTYKQTQDIEANMTNTRWGGYMGAVVCIAGVIIWLALSVPIPASAQIFVTPTPLPAIVATQQAASQLQANARNQAATAAKYQRLADETRRNAAAQEAAAQQAISDARAASAAQNAGAVGEAIGRAESELNQLARTVEGQGEALNHAGDVIRAQASTIITLTNETESLRARVRDLNVAYQAAQVQQVDATRNGTIGNIAASFAFLSAGALLAWLVMGVLQRRHEPHIAPPNDVLNTIDSSAVE